MKWGTGSRSRVRIGSGSRGIRASGESGNPQAFAADRVEEPRDHEADDGGYHQREPGGQGRVEDGHLAQERFGHPDSGAVTEKRSSGPSDSSAKSPAVSASPLTSVRFQRSTKATMTRISSGQAEERVLLGGVRREMGVEVQPSGDRALGPDAIGGKVFVVHARVETGAVIALRAGEVQPQRVGEEERRDSGGGSQSFEDVAYRGTLCQYPENAENAQSERGEEESLGGDGKASAPQARRGSGRAEAIGSPR